MAHIPPFPLATILTDPFDPTRLRPGWYVSRSDSEAYAILQLMASHGAAKLEGERYEPGGVKASLFRVGTGTITPNAAGTIRVGRDFFVNAIRDYDDWQQKWWREAVQNSVDAGASKIDLSSRQLDDGTWRVQVIDNGKGMDEDTLINKFLVLGATTKTLGGETAGGFGKAKELLVLPWLMWEIHSRDVIVRGAGIEYDVSPAPFHHAGTILNVLMPADQYISEWHARAFLEKCNISKVTFTVNDLSVNVKQHPGKLLEQTDKAKIYYNKSAKIHGIFVRTHGIYMFEKWLSSDVRGSVFVELTVPSIEVLAANRDGFRDRELNRKLDDLQNQLAVDVRSALRSKTTMTRELYRGEGMFVVERHQREVLANMPPLPASDDGKPITFTKQATKEIADIVEDVVASGINLPSEGWGASEARADAQIAQTMLQSTFILGQQHLESAVRQLVWQPDFFIANEIEGFRVPSRYKPATMRPTIVRLVKTWAELCRFVLMQLNYGSTYGVGLVFSEDALATHATDHGEDWLLINPMGTLTKDGTRIDMTGKMLSPAKDNDLKLLYSAAIHECTHLVDGLSFHNETFAAAFTKNVALCADGFAAAKKIAKAIGKRNV